MSSSMMVITHNMQSMFTQRQLGITGKSKSKSMEKLSSGYKINRAADDAAGLTISEKMRSLIRGLDKASENIQDGISFLQVGEGALGEVHDMIHRITELAIKSSNGTNTDQDREALDAEVQQIKKEMSRIYNSTEFNTLAIFKAPYIPDIDGQPNDYELFNGSNGSTPAGVLINHKRYTWDELGAPAGVQNTDWVKEIKDSGNPDEIIRFKINAGDTRDKIHRVYIMEADDTGIKINGLYSGKWNDGSIQKSGTTYSWSYRGMDLSFSAEEGDSLSDIISKLNGDGITVNSWDAIPAGADSKKAVSSSQDSMRINVTNDNKADIARWTYQIRADETGVGLVQTYGNDGLNHTKTNWGSFTNQNGGETFPISDWGTENEGANPVTLDSSAQYKYKDSASGKGLVDGIAFTFDFPTSEVNKDQAIVGLTQNLNGSSVNSPIASVTSSSGARVTGYGGLNSFEFQRDQLLRDFGSTGSSSAMNLTVERTLVSDGTVSDHELRLELSAAYAKKLLHTLKYYEYTYSDTPISTTFYGTDGTTEINEADLPAGAHYDLTAPEGFTRIDGDTVAGYGYDANTGLDANWKAEYHDSDSPDNYGKVVTREILDENNSLIGYAKLTYRETRTYHIDKTISYETVNGNIKNYVQDGSGGYREESNSTYYIMDSAGDSTSTGGDKYRTASASDTGQRYVQTGDDWIATDSYDLYHYTYSAKNSAGTTVMSASNSSTFINTNTTAGTITIRDDNGNRVTYYSENNDRVLNTQIGNGPGKYINLKYDATAGASSKTNTLTVTPSGEAYRTFTKDARSAGAASDTNLTVKVNPPQKVLNIQAGALKGQVITLEWPALTNSIVGISGAKVSSVGTSLATIAMAEDALDTISKVRSGFGAMQNRLESAYRIDRNTQENTQAAESLIRDTDMAKEAVKNAKENILLQAGTAMLSQANQSKQGILTLLQ